MVIVAAMVRGQGRFTDQVGHPLDLAALLIRHDQRRQPAQRVPVQRGQLRGQARRCGRAEQQETTDPRLDHWPGGQHVVLLGLGVTQPAEPRAAPCSNR